MKKKRCAICSQWQQESNAHIIMMSYATILLIIYTQIIYINVSVVQRLSHPLHARQVSGSSPCETYFFLALYRIKYLFIPFLAIILRFLVRLAKKALLILAGLAENNRRDLILESSSGRKNSLRRASLQISRFEDIFII